MLSLHQSVVGRVRCDARVSENLYNRWWPHIIQNKQTTTELQIRLFRFQYIVKTDKVIWDSRICHRPNVQHRHPVSFGLFIKSYIQISISSTDWRIVSGVWINQFALLANNLVSNHSNYIFCDTCNYSCVPFALGSFSFSVNVWPIMIKWGFSQLRYRALLCDIRFDDAIAYSFIRFVHGLLDICTIYIVKPDDWHIQSVSRSHCSKGYWLFNWISVFFSNIDRCL